ncbi:MAG: hypothetical protein KGR26_06570, partial [Cyanobacteria bacterium REEB65]|nr:hypothetical protein [Cyanobacteria bacterium REEB65]
LGEAERAREAALRLAEADPEKAALRLQLAETEAELARVRQACEDLRAELSEPVPAVDPAAVAQVEGRIESLEREFAAAQAAFSAAAAERDDALARVEELAQKLAAAVAERDAATLRENEVRSRLSSREEAAAGDSATIGELRQAISALTEQVQRLSAQALDPARKATERPAAPIRRPVAKAKPVATDDPGRKLDWLMGR